MHLELRRQIIATCRDMNARRLNHGSAGNVSARIPDGFLLTPSGLAYDTLEPDDIVAMDLAGGYRGRRFPSSEWRLHQAILEQRPELAAVVHSHAPFCTALAAHGRGLPAFHYMVAVAGGEDIRCAPYHKPGTAELAAAALSALHDRRAALLANHGVVVAAGDLAAALALLEQVELLAEQYWRALQIGEPTILSSAQMAEIFKLFESYGKAPDPALRRLG